MPRKRKPQKPAKEGLPDPKSVTRTETFVSPKGARYTILKTTEQDETDKDKERDCTQDENV